MGCTVFILICTIVISSIVTSIVRGIVSGIVSGIVGIPHRVIIMRRCASSGIVTSIVSGIDSITDRSVSGCILMIVILVFGVGYWK